jgi:Cadherin domain
MIQGLRLGVISYEILLDCRFVFQVRENSPLNTEVGRPTAEDRDVDPSFKKMSFYLDTSSTNSTDDVGRLFRVDPETGIIYSRKPLDREERSTYNMTIAVKSLSSSLHAFDYCHVTVNVIDVNDCPPVIRYPSPSGNDTVRISALSTENDSGPLATVVATDADVGDNARLGYSIAGWKDITNEAALDGEEGERWRSGTGQFFINPLTGSIYVSRADTLDGRGESGILHQMAG